MSRIKVDRITDKAGTGAPILVNGMNVTGKSTMGDIVGAAVTFNSITGGSANFSSNVSIGGTLTYEDVTNIDSVGLITARDGIRVTAGDVAIGLANPGLKLHIQDGELPSAPTPNSNCDVVIEGTTNTGIQFLSGTQTQLRFGDADSTAAGSIIYRHSDDNFRLNFSNSGYLSVYDGGGENLRFTPNNEIGIAGANYGTSGQVLTSGGAGAAVQWATPSGGLTEWDQWSFTNNLGNLGQNMSTAQDLGSGSMGVIWKRVTTTQNPGFEKIGVGMTHSSGVFTFPSVGKYEVSCHVQFRSWDQGRSGLRLSLWTSANGGSSWHGSNPYGTYFMEESTSNANYAYATLNVDGFINIDNTTNKVCKFVVQHNTENSPQIGIFGSSDAVRTNCIFKKLN